VSDAPAVRFALTLAPGEWYVGVYCKRCQGPVPVFHNPGGGDIAAVGRGTLKVACPSCGKRARYRTDTVVSFLFADRLPEADDGPLPAHLLAPSAAGHAQRARVIADLLPKLEGLKQSDSVLLRRAVAQFAAYLGQVPAAAQSRAVIDLYIDAITALASPRAAPLGEQILAQLGEVNRRAGVSS
jgi:hypothetical protein